MQLINSDITQTSMLRLSGESAKENEKQSIDRKIIKNIRKEDEQ